MDNQLRFLGEDAGAKLLIFLPAIDLQEKRKKKKKLGRKQQLWGI